MKFDSKKVEKILKKKGISKQQFSRMMKHDDGWFSQCCRNQSANVDDIRIMEQTFRIESLAVDLNDADKAAGYEDNYPEITIDTLVRARKATGLSQKDFCEKMGAGAFWYKNVVHGYQRFSDKAKRAFIETYADFISEKNEQLELDLKEALPAATESASKENVVRSERTADTITQLTEICMCMNDEIKRISTKQCEGLDVRISKMSTMIATVRNDIKIGNDLMRELLDELKKMNSKESNG